MHAGSKRVSGTAALTVMLLLAVAPGKAEAQTVDTIPLGVSIRLQMAGSGGRLESCDATVRGIAVDTLLIASATCDRSATIADAAFERTVSGSRARRFVQGSAYGALAGGLLGLVAAGDGCNRSYCDDGKLAVVALTVIGASLGAVTGGIGGAVLNPDKEWVAIPVWRVRWQAASE